MAPFKFLSQVQVSIWNRAEWSRAVSRRVAQKNFYFYFSECFRMLLAVAVCLLFVSRNSYFVLLFSFFMVHFAFFIFHFSSLILHFTFYIFYFPSSVFRFLSYMFNFYPVMCQISAHLWRLKYLRSSRVDNLTLFLSQRHNYTNEALLLRPTWLD